MKVFTANSEDVSKEITPNLTESNVINAKHDLIIEGSIPNRNDGDILAKTDVCDERTHVPIYSHTPFPGISRILPSLYLCGAGVAMPAILDELEVKFIVNVAPELPDTPLSIVTKPLYLRVNVMDKPDVDLSTYFNEVADMIEEVRQHDGRTLVHCVAGVSRSATLCIAYLMKHLDMNLRNAYQHVKDIRPQIRPNSGFFQQLMKYEENIFGSSSVQMVYCESLGRDIPDVYEPEYRAMEEFYRRQRRSLRKHCKDSE